MYLMHASVMGAQAQDSIFSALSYADKALSSLETAAKLQPKDPRYLQALMSFHLNAPSIAGGDTEIALELAKTITVLDEITGISAFTNYYRAIDENEKAYATIKIGLQKFPNEIELCSQLASLYVRDENFEQAIETYLDSVAVPISKPTDEALLQVNVNTKYERDLYTLYNSYYQIGRVALKTNTHVKAGIEHLKKYISLYKSSTIDVNGLPSTDWAYLRLAELLLANNQAAEAEAALKLIHLQDNDRMQKIYKRLNKQIKKEIKKSS